jgi:uncharacterized protein (UPF0147 family)
MGATSRRTQASETAKSLGSNPYVRRLIEDEELRQNIRAAFEAARHAYTRMANGQGPASAIIDDKKVHRDLRTAAESLRDASEQIRGKRRHKSGIGRWLLVGLLGAVLVLVLSEGARKALLDKLFGAEEEFEYTSTTTPERESVPSS